MLRTVQLSVFRNSTAVLNEIALDIMQGEKVAIVGGNGAGKSTFLRCLAGLLAPDSGWVELNGARLCGSERRAVARQIAYLPQQVEIWSPIPVKDFMLMARYAQAGSGPTNDKGDLSICLESLERCGMAQMWERELRELSGGERQLVMIAGLLAQQAPILLLDEPTTFLDLQNQHLVQAVLSNLFTSLELTVVCATHDLNTALLGYGRILGMRAGSIVYDGEADAFLENGTLAAVYGRDFVTVQHPHSKRRVVLPDDFGLGSGEVRK